MSQHAACPIQALMTDALILAKATGHDVFNALDCLENQQFLKVRSCLGCHIKDHSPTIGQCDPAIRTPSVVGLRASMAGMQSFAARRSSQLM